MNAAQPFDVININLLQPSGKSTALVVKEWDLIMDVMIQIKEAWPADEPQPGDDNMFDNRQVDLVHNGSHLMDTNLVCQRGINEGDTLLVLFSPLPAGPKRERGGLDAQSFRQGSVNSPALDALDSLAMFIGDRDNIEA
ncbi:unnamed protein product [Symbiodinium microadriaticum]|nr:unnamed protein product [Symbiodinium microadriaticum]